MIPLWKEQGMIGKEREENDPYLKTVVGLLKDRSRTVNELAASAGYFFADPESYEEKAVKKHFSPKLIFLCLRFDNI